MELYARWEMVAVVTGKREMQGKQNKDWTGYMLQLSTLGEKFDVFATNKEQFDLLGEGEQLRFSGILQFDKMRGAKCIIREITDCNTKALVWPRKTSPTPPAPNVAPVAGKAA